MDTLSLILILLAILLGLFAVHQMYSRDDFGQDASVRVGSGWIAGPDYGFDPVADFAKQLEEMRKDDQ